MFLCNTFLVVDAPVDNDDDFIPSEPWEDYNSCTDHIDEGHVCSDVEEPVNLINKPRQVSSLFYLFPFKIFVSPWELVYLTITWCFVLLFFCMPLYPSMNWSKAIEKITQISP